MLADRHRVSIRSLLLCSAALGLVAAASAGHAAAGELPAVSAVNGKLAVAGGVTDSDDQSAEALGLVLGSLAVPLGHAFGLQLDGLAGYQDGDFVGGFGTHLFWRDPEVGLVGVTGAYADGDSGSSSSSTAVTTVGVIQTTTTTTSSTADREVVRLGGEGEYYFSRITLGGHAGYQFGEGVENGFYGTATLRGYPTDDLALSLSGHYAEGSGAAGSVGAEFRPGFDGLPGFALFADATAGEDDFVAALVGFRFYFGPSQTLIDRHRRDDPTVNLVQDAVTTSAVATTVSATSQSINICFAAGTQVLMADGTSRSIETIAAGDCVIGAHGEVNRVLGIDTPLLGDRLLYGFNGGRAFVTRDHPLMTAAGWKAVAPREAAAAHPGTGPIGALAEGDELVMLAGVTKRAVPMAAGAERTGPHLEVVCETALVRLTAIAAYQGNPTQPVFNLRVAGNHTYFADGYLAHNK